MANFVPKLFRRRQQTLHYDTLPEDDHAYLVRDLHSVPGGAHDRSWTAAADAKKAEVERDRLKEEVRCLHEQLNEATLMLREVRALAAEQQAEAKQLTRPRPVKKMLIKDIDKHVSDLLSEALHEAQATNPVGNHHDIFEVKIRDFVRDLYTEYAGLFEEATST